MYPHAFKKKETLYDYFTPVEWASTLFVTASILISVLIMGYFSQSLVTKKHLAVKAVDRAHHRPKRRPARVID